MHEYPITQEIIRIAESVSNEHEGALIKKITIVAGEYSGYIAESIQMYFDIIGSGTVCEHASLDIIKVKPKLKCRACGNLFERRPFSFECPTCKGEGAPTEIGREFYIESVEMDD